jgi:hypothetical protein
VLDGVDRSEDWTTFLAVNANRRLLAQISVNDPIRALPDGGRLAGIDDVNRSVRWRLISAGNGPDSLAGNRGRLADQAVVVADARPAAAATDEIDSAAILIHRC